MDTSGDVVGRPIYDQLPDELIALILGHLRVGDLLKMRTVNKCMCQAASADSLYEALCKRDFGLSSKKRDDLKWVDLYRRSYQLELSGLWVDRGSSNLNDGYPDVEFPLHIMHFAKTGVLLGGGVFPAQSLWEVGLPFRLRGSIKGLSISFDITWPFGYGHSVLSGTVDPEDDEGKFQGTWVTFPSDASAGQINRGRFVSQRKSREFEAQYVSEEGVPLEPREAAPPGGLPAWALAVMAGEGGAPGGEGHPIVALAAELAPGGPGEGAAMDEEGSEEASSEAGGSSSSVEEGSEEGAGPGALEEEDGDGDGDALLEDAPDVDAAGPAPQPRPHAPSASASASGSGSGAGAGGRGAASSVFSLASALLPWRSHLPEL
eukprot:tig00020961_g16725.t1